jgi:hypothetical protein
MDKLLLIQHLCNVRFWCFFVGTVTRHLKVGQEDYVKTEWCRISIELKGVALQDWTLIGGIISSYEGFNTKSLND